MDKIKPYFWRIVCTIIGLLVALSFLFLGFWKTILILICVGIGYGIGLSQDKVLTLPRWLLFWLDR